MFFMFQKKREFIPNNVIDLLQSVLDFAVKKEGYLFTDSECLESMILDGHKLPLEAAQEVIRSVLKDEYLEIDEGTGKYRVTFNGRCLHYHGGYWEEFQSHKNAQIKAKTSAVANVANTIAIIIIAVWGVLVAIESNRIGNEALRIDKIQLQKK